MASTKRSAAEIDRLRFHQAALFLRSVRQKEHPQTQPEKAGLLVKDRLQELERQLFLDDDGDAALSISGVTDSEWSENMEGLLAPSPPITTTTTSSSTSSSNSPCSQTSAAATTLILLDSASAIAEGNTEAAAQILTNLSGSRREGDPKFIGHMIHALLKRIDPALALFEDDQSLVPELCSPDHMENTQILHRSSPCHRIGVLAANFAIFDAVRDLSKIHLLDFDFGDGSQYLSLLDSLASHRPCYLSQIRITAVVDPQNPYSANTIRAAGLPALGDRVLRHAEKKGLRVSFHVATIRTLQLTRAALSCGEDEALVANLAFLLSRIPDESVTPANPRDELLRAVRRMEPRVVALVEEDMNCNTAPLAVRVAEASAHYWAVAETVEAVGGDRVRVEECMGRRAGNSVGEEGQRRVERCEVFGKWRARMGMAGFQANPIGGGALASLRNRVEPGWTVEEEAGGVKVVWKGKAMVVASAWH